ncbi:MAG: zinc ribbon domain-containing protein [Ardenticatenaceae bacterium]|nr:zinc ribbon domain-containing protein [Ardenticatenaceae bacterium]
MTVKTICQECHTPNPPGSKFCSNCGARLPKSTSILCPRCQTPNPSSNFYCDKCGSRLIQEEAPPVSETPAEEDLPTSAKMFSLPTRKPGDTGELNADNVMDWLRSGQSQSESGESDKPETGKLPRLSDLTPEQRGKTADLPAWLVDSENEEFLIEAPEDITTEHFLNMIQQIDDEERKKLSGMLSDPSIAGKGGKLPDWLQEFVQSVEEEKGPPQPEAKPTPSPEKAEADDLDWLNELGPLDTDILAQPVGDADEQQPPTPTASDLPDWLDELQPPNTEMLSRPSTMSDEPSVDAILAGQGVPDWLVGANPPDTDSLSQPGENWVDEESFEDEEEYPDWLVSPPDTSELELPPEPEQEDITAVNTFAQKSVSNWLTDFEEDEEEADEFEFEDAEEPAPTPAAEEKTRKSLTDWLNELDTGDSDSEEEPAETELTAWLTGANESATPADEMTAADWLASIQAEEPEFDEEVEEAPDFGATGPLPDWLDELEPADELAPAPEQTFVSGMLDDILGPSAFDDAAAAEELGDDEELEDEFLEEAEDFTELEPAELSEEPDWLSELAAFDPNELVAQETAVSEPQLDEPEAYDEIDREELPAETEEAVIPAAQAPLPEGGDEEWANLDEILAGVDESEEMADWLEQFESPAEEMAFDSDLPAEKDAQEPFISTGELPEWIASMRPESADQQDSLLPSVLPTAQEDVFAITESLADADLPDWLQDSDVSTPDKTAVPLASAELPVWIDTESELGEPSSELESILADLPPALPPEELLQKAEIPAWIQELKPAELTGGTTSNVDFKLETTGPLAGMPGVIKVEPIVVMPRAISPAAQFSVTKEQQQQASLLRQLVQEEQQPFPPVTAAAPKGRQGLRLLVALLLLAAIGLALFAPNLLTGTAPAVAPPAEAMYTAVNAAAGQPVLVAFEYTPAMAGELNYEAQFLLSQLQANGSPILITSQSAAGTAVATTLTESLNPPPTSLGMLTGEAIGLRQLANCMDSATTCQTLQGRGVSDETQSDLQNVALIIVLTSERTSLVNWVEQVGASTPAPLTAGVTQSLSPVAAPYYASGQLEGYMDGLPATVALVDAHGASVDMAQAQTLYSAQSLIQLAAAVLLAVGALVVAFSRKKPTGQG